MKDNCYAALCWFVPYINTNQPYLNQRPFIVVVQALSYVQLFVTSWIVSHQALCPPLSSGVSNSCPLTQWCYLTFSYSVAPSPFTFSLSQQQGLFQWISSFHQVAKVLELQLHHPSFQWIFRVDSFYDWLVWSPCCPTDTQESSPALQLKSFSF